MVELARTVRFCIPLAASELPTVLAERHNTFAGWPSFTGLGAYYELEVRCRGRADGVTGYLMNISRIDDAVRVHAISIIAAAIRGEPERDPADVLRAIIAPLQAALDRTVSAVTWRLTPFFSITLEPDRMERALYRQHFSFAAAHRLHADELSEDRNREVFGKCNNRHGHGHNYVLAVEVSAPIIPVPPADGTAGFSLPALEKVVDETVIERFDHTNLNLDTEDFAGLIPSVEHIARVCHHLLAPRMGDLGCTLERVTVWETEKTSCSYPA
ncbi:MAG: 6-carboxytetrahydropterin synthase [Planctomycetes bacterium]|nr:6-carboxytetrahydropterin synthase [Planctomycetota bacterium]